MRVYQKLAVATAGLALSFTTVDAIPAQAAVLQYDFVVSIPETPFSENPLQGSTGSGFFTYDDAATPVFDPFGVGYVGVINLEFNFLGNTFIASDDVGFSSGVTDIPFPSVGLKDGVFQGLNYVVTSTSSKNIGFYFTASESAFFAGRGARGSRNEAGGNPVSAAGLSSGGEGLSEGEVTYSFQGPACH
jgi:hypothetical protein